MSNKNKQKEPFNYNEINKVVEQVEIMLIWVPTYKTIKAKTILEEGEI